MQPVPTIIHPNTGRLYRLGRKQPVPSHERRFHLPASRYIRKALPRPSRTNYGAAANACLKQSLLNNELGCCTAAGALHIEGVLRANAGIPVTFSNFQVEAFYSATTGYVPGKPETDQGGDEVTVLDWWREHGLYTSGQGITLGAKGNTHKIAGHLSVNADNIEELKTCLWLFANIYAGNNLPDQWISAPPEHDGFVWGVAGEPNPNNGHCEAFYDYDDADDGLKVASWGLKGIVTTGAMAKYYQPSAGGELHVIISQDMLVAATKKAPNGFAWDELCSDFVARGGNIPSQLSHLLS